LTASWLWNANAAYERISRIFRDHSRHSDIRVIRVEKSPDFANAMREQASALAVWACRSYNNGGFSIAGREREAHMEEKDLTSSPTRADSTRPKPSTSRA
jgi:hypothetical protein